jgi:TPR repeat protein
MPLDERVMASAAEAPTPMLLAIQDRDAALGAVSDRPPPLSTSAERFLNAFGRTGARLVRHAEGGDVDACFRVAIVALLYGWSLEAREWLIRADAAGHPHALALYRHSAPEIPAAEYACQFGRAYESSGADKTSIAMFFYGLAAEHGHAEAAYRRGRLQMDLK